MTPPSGSHATCGKKQQTRRNKSPLVTRLCNPIPAHVFKTSSMRAQTKLLSSRQHPGKWHALLCVDGCIRMPTRMRGKAPSCSRASEGVRDGATGPAIRDFAIPHPPRSTALRRRPLKRLRDAARHAISLAPRASDFRPRSGGEGAPPSRGSRGRTSAHRAAVARAEAGALRREIASVGIRPGRPLPHSLSDGGGDVFPEAPATKHHRLSSMSSAFPGDSQQLIGPTLRLMPHGSAVHTATCPRGRKTWATNAHQV